MTAPRQYLPGTTYFLTRRCLHRRFFLKPSRTTTEVFRYVLAVAAARYGIRLHVACVLSNHYHLVVTDPGARLPDFLRDLNGLVARALNAEAGREEDFWAGEEHSAIALLTPEDIVDKAAYTLANPVAAKLVRRASQWPGLWTAPESVGAGPVEARRPRRFFDPEGPLPEVARFEVTAPPGFTAAAFRQEVARELGEREAEIGRRTTRFLGILAVLSQRTSDGPKAREGRRGIRPKVAAREPTVRMAALARLKAFLEDYRCAMARWREGKEAVFPEGTYLMRVLHGAVCVESG